MFTNEKTAALYKMKTERDRRITIPGVYSGLLSKISPEVAEKLIAMKDNQVEKLPSSTDQKPAAPAAADQAPAIATDTAIASTSKGSNTKTAANGSAPGAEI